MRPLGAWLLLLLLYALWPCKPVWLLRTPTWKGAPVATGLVNVALARTRQQTV